MKLITLEGDPTFRNLSWATLAVVVATAGALSCGARSSGRGVLAPSAQSTVPAAYQPDRAYAPQPDGLLTRRAYQTTDAAPFRAEVLDLIVAPGKSATLRYDGLVVVEARGGAGNATVVEKAVPLGPGATFGLSQGQSARVDNTGKDPLLLRVYVVAMQ